MSSTALTVSALEKAGEDFEWYLTTDEIITAYRSGLTRKRRNARKGGIMKKETRIFACTKCRSVLLVDTSYQSPESMYKWDGKGMGCPVCHTNSPKWPGYMKEVVLKNPRGKSQLDNAVTQLEIGLHNWDYGNA
jgi:RNA polymerase subunit RPABC4/transcription elongation factor Spt4